MDRAYLRRTYRLPAGLEDELVAELWLAGTLGVQSLPEPGGQVRVEAWFAVPSSTRPAGAAAAHLIAERVEAAGDWLAAYRQLATPFALGARFFVDPREPAAGRAEVPPVRFLLRLPARSAFGTGSHASTRLAVELLEAAPPAGLRVLDVGTGTGVLAFAALCLGARSAVAFDRDAAAAFQAGANARLNRRLLGRRRPLLFAGEAGALGAAARFDLLLVNVLPEEILGELPALVRRLVPGAAAVISGILAERGGEVSARLAAAGLRPTAERRSGEWVAFRAELRRERAEAEGSAATAPRRGGVPGRLASPPASRGGRRR